MEYHTVGRTKNFFVFSNYSITFKNTKFDLGFITLFRKDFEEFLKITVKVSSNNEKFANKYFTILNTRTLKHSKRFRKIIENVVAKRNPDIQQYYKEHPEDTEIPSRLNHMTMYYSLDGKSYKKEIDTISFSDILSTIYLGEDLK